MKPFCGPHFRPGTAEDLEKIKTHGVGKFESFGWFNPPEPRRRLDSLPTSPLLEALFQAHAKAAADNANLSKQAAVQAYQGSGDIGKAIMAGICTLGHLHAPLMQAYRLCYLSPEAVGDIRINWQRVPGFGNSFHKGLGDPAFFPVRDMLPDEVERALSDVEVVVRRPANAALYTAIVLHLENLPPEAGMLIFIQARTPVWVQACLDNPPPRLWDGQT